MKIEFTRVEIERIILEHANRIILSGEFNTVTPGGYRDLPDTIVVSVKEENAAQ